MWLRRLRRVVGQLLEGVGGLQAEEPPELVVAGDAALAGAQDVGRGEVELMPVGPGRTRC